MKCNFQVGQKVVLVRGFGEKDTARARRDGVTLPVTNVVYTIRQVVPPELHGTERFSLRFNEIVQGPYWADGIEPAFIADMFRPVIERGTEKGMSILRELLNKTDKPVEELA